MPPDFGTEVFEAGVGPIGLAQQVSYEHGDTKTNLTLRAYKKGNGPTKYFLDTFTDIPIFVECKCCHRVFHASCFIVNTGNFSVSLLCNNMFTLKPKMHLTC